MARYFCVMCHAKNMPCSFLASHMHSGVACTIFVSSSRTTPLLTSLLPFLLLLIMGALPRQYTFFGNTSTIEIIIFIYTQEVSRNNIWEEIGAGAFASFAYTQCKRRRQAGHSICVLRSQSYQPITACQAAGAKWRQTSKRNTRLNVKRNTQSVLNHT